MEPYNTLELSREDGSAWITLNRPDRLNALTGEMYLELERCAEELAADPSVSAIVVTGRGRAFCAGADLESYSEEVDMLDPHSVRDRMRLIGRVVRVWTNLDKPDDRRRERARGRRRRQSRPDVRSRADARGREDQPELREDRCGPGHGQYVRPPATGRTGARDGAGPARRHDHRGRGRADRHGQPMHPRCALRGGGPGVRQAGQLDLRLGCRSFDPHRVRATLR